MNMIHGWNGNHQIFKDLIQKKQPKIIIEVGSWHGQSAITMAHALQEEGLIDSKIYCVDTWLGAREFMHASGDISRDLELKDGYPQVYYTFLKNIRDEGVDDIITPIPNTSLIAARFLQDRGVIADMIYIDASHDADDVEIDVKEYLKLLSSEGVMFGDDYLNRDYTVKEGVLRVLPEDLIEVVDNNFWVYEKR